MNNPNPFPGPTSDGGWELDKYADEHHLVRELHAGAYGRFHQAIAPLGETIPMADFKLPRLIVIGNQHRGKSSLLESITKCPIFPRGKGSFETTTRAPVCLHMEHVKDIKDKVISVTFQPPTGQHVNEKLESENDIVGVVQKIMDSIDKDTILATEVIITIRSPAMTTIEFVDLPGMVEDPPAKRQQTEDLVQSYLADQRNLVLCVEEASCSSLDSTQAVGRVRAQGRASQTIMVLTKADLVDPTVIAQRLWRRALGSSGEPVHKDFAGCVVVINSNHHAQVSLIDACMHSANPHELETLTFERSVLPKLPQMPQHMAQLEPGLRLNLTIPNLIAQVEAMYRRYIIDHWQESARATLRQKVLKAEQVVAQLGLPPEDLNINTVMQEVWEQLDFQQMVLQLCDERTGHSTAIYADSNKIQTLKKLSGNLPDYGYHTLEHREQLKTMAATAMSSIDQWMDQAAYLKIVHRAIRQAFKAKTASRLARFLSLKDEIIQHGIQRAVNTQQIRADLMADLRPIAAMMRLHFTLLRSGLGCLRDMEQAAQTAVIQEVFLPLRQPALFAACVPDSFPLVETAADQQRREETTRALLNLRHALNVVDTIHIQVDKLPAS